MTMESHSATRASFSVSEKLEDHGYQSLIKNQELSLHLLSESMHSEQQKLRQVLDWTHTFLSKGSEVHSDFCRAESLIPEEKSPSYEHLTAARYQHVSCRACCPMFLKAGDWKLKSNYLLCLCTKPLWPDHPLILNSSPPQKDDITQAKNLKSIELLDATIKQTLSQEDKSRTSSKNYTSSCNRIHPKILSDEVCKEREILGHKVEPTNPLFEKTIQTNIKKEKTEDAQMRKLIEEDSSKAFTVFARNQKNQEIHKEGINDNFEITEGQSEMTSSLSHLKIPQISLTVYEQYQLCVDHLCDLRGKRRKQTEPVCFIKSPAKEGETSEQTTPNPENHKPLDKVQSGMSANKHTKKQSSVEKKDNKKTAILEHRQTKSCDNLKGKVQSKIHSDHDSEKCNGSIENIMEGKSSTNSHISVSEEQEETDDDDNGASALVKKSSFNIDQGVQQCDQPAHQYNYQPAGDAVAVAVAVAVAEHCLSLPDEVWLSILSLLPLRDLSRVTQVCKRLHTLATDHTLWRDVWVEDSTLKEHWFLLVAKRRPLSLSLNNCSGPSLRSCVLEKFFTLCRHTLEEIRVTSCTGSGLRGDQIMSLIGQLCDHVTSVDVSWSGATHIGVEALSECCQGLRLKSVILNGCHVTDGPTIKLIKRHKESLRRLEVFGCQYLTPSCLKTIYEICPGLQHLNIGQVPKVNTDCLTAMTAQFKCLISLNLAGLQAVSETTMDTLLQNCVELQSLTLSSCPGVTDLTLHSISTHTPFIKSLDVSGCKAVTDTGVESLAVGCRRLQQLDLSSTNTGNRGVDMLAHYSSGHLKTVKLSFCHISTENILKLCRCCKRLEVLHLYGCARVPTEREIRQVNAAVKVHPLPSLSHKHLHNTRQIHAQH